MVNIILGILCIFLFITFIFSVIICLFLVFKLWKISKNNKEDIIDIDNSVQESPKESEQTDKNKEEDKKQLDYIEGVYKLVDDVLSGKQELGDNKDEA